MTEPFDFATYEEDRLSQLDFDAETAGPSASNYANQIGQVDGTEHGFLLTDMFHAQTADAEQDETSEQRFPVIDKSMAELASQKFKRKAKDSDSQQNKRVFLSSLESQANVGSQEDEEPDLDEAETAEMEEFYSQMIDDTAEGPTQTGGNSVQRLIHRHAPRWHMREQEFFRKCIELFDLNYSMLHELLPHRPIPEIKKQHDKMRRDMPLFFVRLSTTPRFQTVAEYRERKRALEEEGETLFAELKEQGYKAYQSKRQSHPFVHVPQDSVQPDPVSEREAEELDLNRLEHPELYPEASEDNHENAENQEEDNAVEDSMDQFRFQLNENFVDSV